MQVASARAGFHYDPRFNAPAGSKRSLPISERQEDQEKLRGMNWAMETQGEFDFENAHDDQGFTRWVTARKLAAAELARRLNLPLSHEVEVWLVGGIRLRGKLRLQEEMLFIEEDRVRHLVLQVDNVPFTMREMESCVRLD